MKRILIISYHTCPLASEEGKETGGMNVYVSELSKHLSKLGYKVDAITRCQEKNNSGIVDVDKNFRVIHLKAGPHKPINKKELISYIPEFVESFKKFIKEEGLNYDLIHAHYYQSGLIAQSINEILPTKLPVIMNFHTLALMKNLVARSTSEMESQFRIDAELNLVKTVNAIITPSESDKEYLKYLYGAEENKIYEVPPGVNTELFKPIPQQVARDHLSLKTNEKIILFVGRIEPLKGIDLLLYSLKILVSQRPDLPIRLLIVGGDVSQHIDKWSPQLKQLERLRSTLGLSAHVDFVGQQPQHELPYYYNAAEAVVMPSHYESFGMALAEAMACGTPIITTNVTGISSLIDEERSTLITSVNNPLLLASQIKELLTNEQIYEQIEKRFQEEIKKLDWKVIAQKIADIYLEILKIS